MTPLDLGTQKALVSEGFVELPVYDYFLSQGRWRKSVS